MDLPENLTEAMLEAENHNDKENQFDMSKIRFMMSSLGEEIKNKFTIFVVAKGASVSTTNSCDPLATHILAQKLSRSEKMLGMICWASCCEI
jgi:hypothetical protein